MGDLMNAATKQECCSGILHSAQSICPICHKAVEAFYIEEDNKVYFIKECSDHGTFKTLAAENADDYKRWVKNPVINIPPKSAQTKGDPDDFSCPLHCGTCENHLQTACCVLIDITDRCNQHCPYCFAKSELDADRSGESTLEEINDKYDLLLELGEERSFNIQLSGGEPTVRDDLPQIIKMARDKGFEYVQINTNGRRLATEDGYAQTLKDAGASVIFMQFDGTRDDIYEQLRGEPLFETKVKAIRNCEKAGLAVTLVPTIVEGVNTDNIGEMMDFLIENVNVVKGIHFQPVSFFGRYPEKMEDDVQSAGDSKAYIGDFPGRITMFGLLRKLEEQSPSFKYEDFLPITTGHTLCCFYSTYTKEPDGSIKCVLTSAQRSEGVSCCDTTVKNDCCYGTEPAAEGVSCCDMTSIDSLEVIRKDRDFVLNKWEIAAPQEECCCEAFDEGSCCCEASEDHVMDLDEFLRYYRQNTFTVTGMAFQDIMNIDAERVKRCRVQQLSKDNKLIPFCAYNTIYRED